MAALFMIMALASIVSAEMSYFLWPPQGGDPYTYVSNINLTVGSNITLQWYSEKPTYNLNLYQQPLSGGSSNLIQLIRSIQDKGTGIQSYNWTVNTYGASLETSPIFFIEGAYVNTTRIFSSHYFNVTAAQSSGPSATESASSGTSTSTAPGTANTTATTVGLGVGLGVGIPLLLVAFGFLLLKWNRDRRAARLQEMSYTTTTASQPALISQQQHYQQVHEAPPKENVLHEAPNTFGPYEVSGGPNK